MSDWSTFLTLSLRRRLDVPTFSALATQLHSRCPLPAPALAALFLAPRPHDYNAATPDPRLLRYVQALLALGLVDVSSVLAALLRFSSLLPSVNLSAGASKDDGKFTTVKNRNNNKKKRASGNDGLRSRWASSLGADEAMLYRCAREVARKAPGTEMGKLIVVVTRWMRAVGAAGAADDVLRGLEGGHGDAAAAGGVEVAALRAALGTLLAAMVEREGNQKSVRWGCGRDTRKEFSQALADFLPSVVEVAPQVATRLELFRTQTLVPMDPAGKKEKAADKVIDEMIDEEIGALAPENISVPEISVTNSRAGLYVYLNAVLVGRPIVNDNAIFNYLQNRYQGDIQLTTIDLILSSFDILSNATFRNSGTQTTLLLRSFLINKIPLLLTTLSASMYAPLTPEFCITEALSQVDTNAFPTFSSMFDDSSSTGNIFSDSVRQDFCFACCLHGLIPEESIERLLGEVPMQTLPAGGRYEKDSLVGQCLVDPERTISLVDELESMDGNVGAACQAVAEIVGRLCSTRETATLKTLCGSLSRKPSTLDIMQLFTPVGSLLAPLAEILDSWRYDEEQSEYQAMYEEFGAILLLVLSFVQRYQLMPADIGIQRQDSFVARLIIQGSVARPLEELGEREMKQLDGWIHELFDGEAGGLGDDLMSSCPPQEFYMLVPTLFEQIVLGCSTGHLREESLKGGLEYIVDTYLRPSLVPILIFLANQLITHLSQPASTSAILSILNSLISPISISSEASTMHSSILNLVAAPLELSLRQLQRTEPSRQDIEPLSRILKSHLGFLRTGGSDLTELEGWTSTPHSSTGGTGESASGVAMSLKTTIQALVGWSLNPGVNVTPASYTHRQLLVATRLIGARRVLLSILDEVHQQTLGGSGAVVLDVATALICAPNSASLRPTATASTATTTISLDANGNASFAAAAGQRQRRLGLRDALKTEVEAAGRLHRTDEERAEGIVRLWRRVEAQMADNEIEDILVGVGSTGVGAPNGLQPLSALDVVDVTGVTDMDLGGLRGDVGGLGSSGDGALGDQDMMDVLGGHDGFGSLGGGDADNDLLDGMKLDLSGF